MLNQMYAEGNIELTKAVVDISISAYLTMLSLRRSFQKTSDVLGSQQFYVERIWNMLMLKLVVKI